MRAVVNVSFGERFLLNGSRLERALTAQGENLIRWHGLPFGSPTHEETPFAFKAFALHSALEQGATVLLWADSSIVPLQSLDPLWALIEQQGYWFSENFPHGRRFGPWTNGQWTSDAALVPLGITRAESFTFPHVIATAFGLDTRQAIAQQFLAEYLRLATEGTAFQGGLSNHDLSMSKDRRVLGHRHDQTAASVIAWRLGMLLTKPPAWIVDGIPATADTILEIRR
jgi:hypothetical protein